MNIESLLKDIFDYDPDGANIHHLMAVHGYSRLIAQTYYIVNLMEGYCKRDSIPAMKENVFKTESGKYLLQQMF